MQRVAVPAGATHAAPAATSVDPDALPWGQVGPGWSVVAYTTHPSTGTGTDYPQPVCPLTVALVSPAGHQVVASQVLGTGRTTVLVRAPWLSAVTVGERP